MPWTNLTRRTMLGALAAVPFARSARAQATWPTKPVRVMVPYPPAGGADTTGRIVFGKLGEALGQQFVVENRGGAGGTIGEAVVAKASRMATPCCTTPRRSQSIPRSIQICRSTTTRTSTRSRWCRWCRTSWW